MRDIERTGSTSRKGFCVPFTCWYWELAVLSFKTSLALLHIPLSQFYFAHSFRTNLPILPMAQALRMPILASAALSICLSLAIIGCAGRSLSIFDDQQASNAWLLPIWPNHFDTREMHALIGTSAAVMILNFIPIATLFIQSVRLAFPTNPQYSASEDVHMHSISSQPPSFSSPPHPSAQSVHWSL